MKELDHQPALLEAACFAAERFLQTAEWDANLPEIVERLGRAANAGRACLYRIELARDGDIFADHVCAWDASAGSAGDGAEDSLSSLPDLALLRRWRHALQRGQSIHGLAQHFPEEERALLSAHGIQAIVSVPIRAGEQFWGGLTLIRCSTGRPWSPAEVDAMAKAAGILGAALARNRSAERTRERKKRYGPTCAFMDPFKSAGPEEALRQSEQLYRMIFNHSPLGIMHFDESGLVVDCNERFLQIVGSTREAMIGLGLLESLQNESLKAAVQTALAGSTGYYEGEYSSGTGSKLTFLGAIFCPVVSEKGELLCGLCIAEDISECRQAEHALCQSEARYRAIVEDQTELISRFTPDGTLTFVNEAYCRYFGERTEELIGNKFWHHLPPEDHEKFKAYLARMNARNQVMSMEHRVYTSTGELRWQQWTDRAILDDQGRIVEFQGVGRDVTERKKAEEALQESEKQLRLLSSQILKAQENERQRIARDLHDSVIQSLATMKVNLSVNLRHLLRGEVDKTRESFESIISMIGDSIAEVRRVYTDLRPTMLDNLGIIATVNWACQEFQEAHGEICVQSRTDVREEDIPEGLKIIIYRIIQDAFDNIARHSKATHVKVSLSERGRKLLLKIEDNGCGFNMEAVLAEKKGSQGLGLLGMKERTELSGGTFSVESNEQAGTTIRSSWMCDPSIST